MPDFVSISPKDFRARLPQGFEPCQLPGSREIVFIRPVLADRRRPAQLHTIVFTGIELGAQESREAGEDAIHVALWHDPSAAVLVSEARVNRVGSVGGTMDRVLARIRAVEARVLRDACPTCGSPLLQMSSRGGRSFVGCSGFKPRGCKFTRAARP